MDLENLTIRNLQNHSGHERAVRKWQVGQMVGRGQTVKVWMTVKANTDRLEKSRLGINPNRLESVEINRT